MKKLSKKLTTFCLSALLAAACVTYPAKAEGASWSETFLYGYAAYAYTSYQLANLNDHHQKDLLLQTQRNTGVYDNAEMKDKVDAIASRLMSNGLIKGRYAVYVTPDKSFNAFCTLGRVIAVNKGAVAALDDDELAAVIGHEMSHGEHKDPVEGVKKMLGLNLMVDLYLANNQNTASAVLGSASENYINNEVITMQQEWNADNSGFDNAVAAGYNPGGGAASMVKLRALLGELWHEGLSKVISPNNHPKTSDRVHNFAQHMTDFSQGHITVKNDKTVQIDGLDVVTPVKTSRYLAEERAYLIAGNLATVYHNHALAKAVVGDDGAVYIGQQKIMTVADGDTDAHEIADRINAITNQNTL